MSQALQQTLNFDEPAERSGDTTNVVAPIATAKQPQRIEVPLARLKDGDIDGSLSAHVISEGRVRKPFKFGGRSYVATSGAYYDAEKRELKAYELVSETLFKEPSVTFSEKVGPDLGATAREDPFGFYHGVRVAGQGKKWVLSGPPLTFYCGGAGG